MTCVDLSSDNKSTGYCHTSPGYMKLVTPLSENEVRKPQK